MAMSFPIATPSTTSPIITSTRPIRRQPQPPRSRPASTTSAMRLTLFNVEGIGQRYRQAYERGLISMDDIDRALIRLFSARYRNGDLPGLPARKPDGSAGNPSRR